MAGPHLTFWGHATDTQHSTAQHSGLSRHVPQEGEIVEGWVMPYEELFLLISMLCLKQRPISLRLDVILIE